MSETPALDALDEMVERELRALRKLPPMARIVRARELGEALRAMLGHVGDEATYLASIESDGPRRLRSQVEMAKLLNLHKNRVSRAIGQYREWVDQHRSR